MNCYQTENFIKELSRMCEKVGQCELCPLITECNGCEYFSTIFEDVNIPKMIEIVQQWSDENPIRTRVDVALEKFPTMPVDKSGLPMVCVRFLFGNTIKCGQNCTECWKTVCLGW